MIPIICFVSWMVEQMRKHSDQIHEYTYHSLQGYRKLFRGGAGYNTYSILRISMPFNSIDRMIDLRLFVV